jgi:hypothetical protein
MRPDALLRASIVYRHLSLADTYRCRPAAAILASCLVF